jgi:very-short-patch-repair endonuclease
MRNERTRRPDSRKDFRRQATAAEQVLWEAIRDRQVCGLKFRRQHPVKPYVLDFYCPDWMLAVEVDGGVHDWEWEEDEIRTAYLEGQGYRVLRFRNEEVLHHLDAVLARIAATVSEIEAIRFG